MKSRKNKIIGYTQGVFDMFHIGHLNVIKAAKSKCDYLIIGVNSDSLTKIYKNKTPIIPEDERLEIVSSIKYVDMAVIVNVHDKMDAYNRFQYDVIFVGDDHKGEESWKILEAKLEEVGAKVMYLPYTTHTSSTKLRSALDSVYDDSIVET